MNARLAVAIRGEAAIPDEMDVRLNSCQCLYVHLRRRVYQLNLAVISLAVDYPANAGTSIIG